MYTKIKLKYIAFILGVSCFLFLPYKSYAQASTGTSTITSTNDNGFSIGFYGAPNATWANSGLNNYPQTSVKSDMEIGYDYSLLAKINLYKRLFFCTGVSYEIQKYGASNIGYDFIFPGFNFPIKYSISNYNIGIPLIVDYGITKKKWSFYAGAGLEFFYNFENKITETNTSPSLTDYFYNGHGIITTLGTPSDYWNMLGAFGLLQARLDYRISPKLSISYTPVLRFTDPFAENPFYSSFDEIVRQNNFSFNVGINYRFSNNYLAGDYQDGNDEKENKFSIGFSLIPNDVVNKITPTTGAFFYPHTNNRFSFSYAIPVQYDISKHIGLESGIAIDNFNFMFFTTNTLIGLPIIVKLYLPLDENQNNSLYIGIGCHFDYPTNLGWLYYPTHPFILPLALGKVGYRRIVGKNYYFDANVGYEVSFNNIQSSIGNHSYADAEPEITGLPRYVFGSVGFGCRL